MEQVAQSVRQLVLGALPTELAGWLAENDWALWITLGIIVLLALRVIASAVLDGD